MARRNVFFPDRKWLSAGSRLSGFDCRSECQRHSLAQFQVRGVIRTPRQVTSLCCPAFGQSLARLGSVYSAVRHYQCGSVWRARWRRIQSSYPLSQSCALCGSLGNGLGRLNDPRCAVNHPARNSSVGRSNVPNLAVEPMPTLACELSVLVFMSQRVIELRSRGHCSENGWHG